MPKQTIQLITQHYEKYHLMYRDMQTRAQLKMVLGQEQRFIVGLKQLSLSEPRMLELLNLILLQKIPDENEKLMAYVSLFSSEHEAIWMGLLEYINKGEVDPCLLKSLSFLPKPQLQLILKEIFESHVSQELSEWIDVVLCLIMRYNGITEYITYFFIDNKPKFYHDALFKLIALYGNEQQEVESTQSIS